MSIRKKGKNWQATVYLPSGRRRSMSFARRRDAEEWKAEQQRDKRRGDLIDPRAGAVTVGQAWERMKGSRRLEKASRLRDESHWRCHVAPAWVDTPLAAVLPPDVEGWVVRMERAGTGATTVEGSLGVLRAIMTWAVQAKLIRTNPVAGVRAPERDEHLDRVLGPEEDELLLAALDRVAGGRPDGRLFGELLLYGGLRWEEAAAVDRDHVDLRGGLLHIGPVVERDGTIRPYPKTPAGRRPVPVPDHLWPRLRERAVAAGPGGLLVPAPRRNGPLSYTNWYQRVWRPALEGRPARPGSRGHPPRLELPGAGLESPPPTPHDLRHTYGTRLAEQGVPPHEIMALMGHESLASVQRYIHANESRFDRARRAVQSGRAWFGRDDLANPSQTQPSPATRFPRSQGIAAAGEDS